MTILKEKKYSLPTDWNRLRLGDIVLDTEYGTSKKTNDSEGTLVLGMSSLSDGKIFQNESKRVKLSNEEFSRLRLNKKDILFNRTNSYEHIGKTALFELEGDYVFASYLVRLKINKDKIIPEYLNYYMNTHDSKIEMKRLSTKGVQQVNINPTSLRKMFYVLLPPLKEQQKIVDIISTWDKAIELKEQLIEQKKEQKKGLMQKLLTGEVRMPGFDDEWKEKRLGELYKDRKETGYNHLELLAITSAKGVVRRTEVDIKDTSSEDKSKYKRILPNDIGYNTMRMWQGVSGVSKYEGIVSPAYTILKPTKNVDSHFMGYLFKLPKIIDLFKRYSQGLVNDTLNLKYTNFKVIKVKIPDNVEEQKAIKEILCLQDKGIEVLEKEMEQLKQQKKGLMQLLLTGKVRVKV